MDPSAPDNNNNQNPDNSQQQNPIQPGQFVVASEDSLAQAPAPQNPAAFVQPPQPAQEPAPTFSQAYQPVPQPYASQQFQVPGQPPTNPPGQPDPTPFTPPGPPINGQAAQQPPQSSGKGKMIKILGIALGIISLLVIIGALLWFFVLDKKPAEDLSTGEVIQELPEALPAEEDFSELPESTEEAPPTQQPALPPQEPPATLPTQ